MTTPSAAPGGTASVHAWAGDAAGQLRGCPSREVGPCPVRQGADLVGGVLEGAEVGSGSLAFWPGEAEPGGRYEWDIGTAGSATMLALAVLPVMAVRGRGAEAEIRGGLFQALAPSAFHLQRIIVPLLAQMGITSELGIIRPGYVPAGEGVIRLAVMWARGPPRPLTPVRGDAPPRISGVSLASHLEDGRVAERIAAAAIAVLQSAGVTGAIDIAEVRDRAAAQPGAAFATAGKHRLTGIASGSHGLLLRRPALHRRAPSGVPCVSRRTVPAPRPLGGSGCSCTRGRRSEAVTKSPGSPRS
jgi:RNA 3'-terminal phosphate cyclase